MTEPKTHTLTLTDEQYQDYLDHLTYPANVVDVKKPNKKEFGEDNPHQTIKPEKLMQWLVKLLSNENDTVLDIFAGSGTTLKAATDLNRKAIGIELNKEYATYCKTRAPNAVVYQGDCIEQLKQLEANSVDSVICDPPYNIKMADWDAFETDFKFSEWCEKWATEAFRVLRPGGTIAVFGAARTYHYVAIALDKAGFKCRDMIEWVYWTSMPKGKNLKSCHEPIYLGMKPDKKKGTKTLTINIDACRIPVKQKAKKIQVGNMDIEVKHD